MLTRPVLRTLLASTSLVAGAGVTAHAQEVNGGGSTLASNTYKNAFTFFQVSNPGTDFSDFYVPSGSGAAQNALIQNTANAAGGTNVPFDFGASDATITDSTQLYGGTATSWNTVSTGKAAAGLLVEVPSFGTPITVAIKMSGITGNGQVNLTDAQVCGIFSGKIVNSNDSALAGSGIPSGDGPLTVYYRNETSGSGTSFLFTQHLSAVCNTGNSKITFSPQKVFATEFAGSTPPSNFVGEAGSGGVQSGIDGSSGAAIGYLSPDYTAIAPANANNPSAPFVANVDSVSPTPANTLAALAAGVAATDPTVNAARTQNNPADPNSFVPVAAVPPVGTYPIVGYTTLLLAQCYADPTVAAALKAYIGGLYRNAPTRAIISSGGFTPIPTALANVITADYLVTSTTSATAINGAGVGGCKGLAGR